MIFSIKGPDQMIDVANEIIARASVADLSRAFVCTLSGDLGAGKTTLTQSIAKELGINESIQSPTFVLRKRYQTADTAIKQLIHIDAYRLDSGTELEKIRFNEDLQQSNTLICLEWPQQVADIGIVADLEIQIEHIDETTRTITLVP